MAMGVMPTRSATGRIATAARPSRSRISRATARIRAAVSVLAGAGLRTDIISIRRIRDSVYTVCMTLRLNAQLQSICSCSGPLVGLHHLNDLQFPSFVDFVHLYATGMKRRTFLSLSAAALPPFRVTAAV